MTAKILHVVARTRIGCGGRRAPYWRSARKQRGWKRYVIGPSAQTAGTLINTIRASGSARCNTALRTHLRPRHCLTLHRTSSPETPKLEHYRHHAFHRKRHHQDHLGHLPPAAGRLPRARLQRRLLHQHPADHPRLHSRHHPRAVHYPKVLAGAGASAT